MKYSLVIKEEAHEDIHNIYLWYEDQLNDLGERFLQSLDNCFSDIIHNPFIFEVKFKDQRHGFLDTFPYILIYRIEDLAIVVYAVFNTHRNPKVWKDRIK